VWFSAKTKTPVLGNRPVIIKYGDLSSNHFNGTQESSISKLPGQIPPLPDFVDKVLLEHMLVHWSLLSLAAFLPQWQS
jgi:hypothetical protein